MKDWIRHATEADLPEQCKEIASVIGVEATLALCDKLGGGPIYLPKVDRVEYNVLRKRIQAEYNGYNVKQLARKYNLCTRTVELYLQGQPPPQIDGQVDMFGT